MLRDMDRAGMAFVVNVGDIKRASEPCSNELLRERHALLDASPRPLVFMPGDNEWADCHTAAAGEHDPRERLDALRALFFAGDESLGRARIRLVATERGSRASARTARTRAGSPAGSCSPTFNVPGSNNNLGGACQDDQTRGE